MEAVSIDITVTLIDIALVLVDKALVSIGTVPVSIDIQAVSIEITPVLIKLGPARFTSALTMWYEAWRLHQRSKWMSPEGFQRRPIAPACGAGDSIEPGVRRSGTPGIRSETNMSPGSGRQLISQQVLSPTSWALIISTLTFLGFRFASPQALCCRLLCRLNVESPADQADCRQVYS